MSIRHLECDTPPSLYLIDFSYHFPIAGAAEIEVL